MQRLMGVGKVALDQNMLEHTWWALIGVQGRTWCLDTGSFSVGGDGEYIR